MFSHLHLLTRYLRLKQQPEVKTCLCQRVLVLVKLSVLCGRFLRRWLMKRETPKNHGQNEVSHNCYVSHERSGFDQVSRLRRMIGDPDKKFIKIFRNTCGDEVRRPNLVCILVEPHTLERSLLQNRTENLKELGQNVFPAKRF